MKKSLLLLLALGIVSVSANAQGAYKSRPAMQPKSIVNVAKYEATKQPKLSTHQSVVGGAVTPTKMLSTKALKNGAKIEIAECNDGNIHKRIVDSRKSAQPNLAISKFKKMAKVESTNSFYENFESYDGDSFDWIPAGWSDVSKTNPPHEAPDSAAEMPNLTWTVCGSDYDPAHEGDYYARCQVSIANEDLGLTEEAQDEWLITPTITVAQFEKLYFTLGYRPGWVLFDIDTYEFTAQNNIVEVQISEDNGTTWEKVWDCLADAQSYTEDELWDDLGSMSSTYINVKVDLSKYEGKDIKVAFRYVGQSGESATIDAVKVGVPSPKASYAYPRGSFRNGFAMDYSSVDFNMILLPAYSDITWTNTSNDESETFEWEYDDPDEKWFAERLIATTKDLTISCIDWAWDMPKLTAKAAHGEDDVYVDEDSETIQTGGYIYGMDDDYENIILFGACNYDNKKEFSSFALDEQETSFLFGTGSNDTYKSIYNADSATLTSIANYFEAPTHSYAISKVWINAKAVAEPDAEFTLNIIKISDDGYLTDTIATSVCKGSDFIPDSFEAGYVSLPFSFKNGNDSIITIDSAVFLTLSGFQSDKVSSFAAFAQSTPNDEDNYAYMFVDVEKDGKVSQKLLSASQLSLDDEGTALNTALLFNMDATYTYFVTEDDVTDINAPYDGCRVSINASSNDVFRKWKVTDADGNDLPDWIRVNLEVCDDIDLIYTVIINFKVDANDEDVPRSADVLISQFGENKIFKVTQGTSGIAANKNDSNIKVSVSNGDFVIDAVSDVSNVCIYNAAGQKVADAPIANGNVSIDGSHLSAGVYMLKFDNGSMAKVIK